jgi:hypothetical protein
MSRVNLPELRVVPTQALLLHEYVDANRLLPVAVSLKNEGSLRNPPLVWELGDLDQRYLVLDGANRVVSSRAINLDFLVVQVVRRVHEEIKLETWTQVILSCSPLELLHTVTAIPEIRLCPSNG